MEIKGTSIYITRGDTDNLTIKITDHALTEDEDIIEMTVRKVASAESKYIYKKITSFVDGKAVINFTSSDTESMNFGEYVYDIQWTDANGNVRTIVKPSRFVINEEVTY